MPIAVMCPKCGEQGRVPDGYRESVTCRGCRTQFRVEGPGTPAPPAPVDPIDPGVKPAPADPPGKPRRPHQVNLNVVAASASAVVLITAAGLLVAFAWPSGEDDPLAGIAATTRISDDEGDRMIDRALDRWTDAVKQFSVDQSDKSDAFQARRRAEFGAVIDRVSAPH